MRPYVIDMTIAVSGGVGQSILGVDCVPSGGEINGELIKKERGLYGSIKKTCIKTPGQSSQHSYTYSDSDGFVLIGGAGFVGPTTDKEDCDVGYGGVFQLLNASDGTYSVRLYLKHSEGAW